MKVEKVKITMLSHVLVHQEIMCLKGEAAICGARLLSVFRQVGAHPWHEGPAGGLSGIRTHNLLTLACLEVQALPLSYLLLALIAMKSGGSEYDSIY